MPRRKQPVEPVEVVVELPPPEYRAQLVERLARFLLALTEPDETKQTDHPGE